MTQYSYNFFGQQQTYLSADLNKLYPTVSLAKLVATAPPSVNLANTFKIKELTNAGFAKADFVIPNTGFSGNIGLRVVQTTETSSGYSPDLSLIRFNQQGAQTIVPQVTAVSIDRTYTNVLPSLNLSYDTGSDIILRFAAAKTLTRPDLSQIAPNTVVNANVQSITKGNPQLKPYSASQYDLSAEWYFEKGGLLSVALFYKDVKDFVQNGLSSTTLNVNQVQGGTIPVTFSVLQPVNAGATTVKGAEISFQLPFTFLPAPFDGFGALLNYTYVEADPLQVIQGAAPVALAGVSKNNASIVGYFENDVFGVRAAYTYRDNYVVDPYSYFGDGDSRQAYGQLDLSATYHINEQFDATLEALNVTDNALIDVDKYGINRGYETDGRTILFGLRAKF
jgi:iron complex outermembrane receptor protein